MQLLDWISLGVAGVTAIVIVVLVARQWQKLKLIDLEAMPREKLRSKKYQLIEERLERKTQGVKVAVQKLFSPVSGTVSGLLHRAYVKLQQLERRYRHPLVSPQNEEEKERRRQKVTALLVQGREVFSAGNYGEAEQIFLDIIRLNPQEVEAYEYLGEVYSQKKEYEHAIETLQFAQKLNPNEDRIYYDLGMVYTMQGNVKKALENLKECVRLSPNNPRPIDSLLDLAIQAKDRVLAVETLRKLKEANPENQKIADFEKQIQEL